MAKSRNDSIQAVPAYLCPLCRGWFTAADTTRRPVCPACRAPVIRYHCIRCDHEWNPMRSAPPRICPTCKSPYWNRPRRTEGPMPGPVAVPAPAPQETAPPSPQEAAQ